MFKIYSVDLENRIACDSSNILRLHNKKAIRFAIAFVAALGLTACSDSEDPVDAVNNEMSEVSELQADPDVSPDSEVLTAPETSIDSEITQDTAEVVDNSAQIITEPTVLWSQGFPGSVRARSELIGTDDLALVRSTELDNFQWLTAVVPDTGEVLWRQSFMNNQCGPAITADGNVVAQLNAEFSLAGEDRSHDIVLFDGTTGDILDQWQPGLGVLAPCASGSLLINDSGNVIHFERGLQKGFRITTSNELELIWENNSLDFFDTYDEVALLGNNLYVIQKYERSAADGVDVVYVLRMDSNSGAVLNTYETDMRSATSITAVGADHLLINGKDINNDEYSLLFTGVGPSSIPGDITLAWNRVFNDSGNGDGVTFGISSYIALSEGAFASWSKTQNTSTVTEFSLDTGLANWSFPTSSFSNNDTIAALPKGGYTVAPFGGNFLEATSADGDVAWVLESVEGLQFPAGFRSLGDKKLLVTAPRADGGWAITGIRLPD